MDLKYLNSSSLPPKPEAIQNWVRRDRGVHGSSGVGFDSTRYSTRLKDLDLGWVEYVLLSFAKLNRTNPDKKYVGFGWVNQIQYWKTNFKLLKIYNFSYQVGLVVEVPEPVDIMYC